MRPIATNPPNGRVVTRAVTRAADGCVEGRATEDSPLASSILVKIVLLRTVAGLVGLGLLVGCGSGGDSNRAIVNTIVLTRDDGSRFAVRGPISFTCGPASGDGPRALRVLVGQRMPGAQQPFWTVQVGLRDLKRKRIFRFPRDGVGGYAVFFAFDAEGGENELSSSEEEASGQIVFREADCREGADFRIRAHLGSEFFEQPGADVRGRFAAPGS